MCSLVKCLCNCAGRLELCEPGSLLRLYVLADEAFAAVASPVRRAGVALSWLSNALMRVRALRSKLDGCVRVHVLSNVRDGMCCNVCVYVCVSHRASIDGTSMPVLAFHPSPAGVSKDSPRRTASGSLASPPAYSLSTHRTPERQGSKSTLAMPVTTPYSPSAGPHTAANKHVPVRSNITRHDSGGASSIVVSASDSMFPGPSVLGSISPTKQPASPYGSK